MKQTTGRYTFKNTSLETSTGNKRFSFVMRSLAQSGATVQTEEIGNAVVLTFQTPMRAPKPARTDWGVKRSLPPMPTRAKNNKELEATKTSRSYLLRSRIDDGDSYRSPNPCYLHHRRMRQRCVGMWIARNREELRRRGSRVKLDYSLLEAAGIHETKAKYPRKSQQSFEEYLISTVRHKPYERADDSLLQPHNWEALLGLKADKEYLEEMRRLLNDA